MRIDHTMIDGRVRAWSALAAALAISLAGCARARPAVEPDLPPLAAPLPPPRELPPLEGGPIEVAAPTTAEEPPVDPRPTPRRRQPRPPAAAPVETARQDPVPPEALPPAPEPAANAPAPVLQLAPPGEESRVQQAVRQQLTKADRDLANVDYRALGSDARAQYDTAKRFAQLAEQALKERNLVFAQTLADKAAAIASVLAR
jgi:hypothetical protein